MLRPGAERVAALGGLHAFANWPGPILTDSGGFQVMSLAKLREIDDDGVTFQSHIDGSTPPPDAGALDGDPGAARLRHPHAARRADRAAGDARAESERAVRLSLRWAERSQGGVRRRRGPRLFGIVQGGDVAALRVASAEALAAIGFDGYAIGGLAVGEPQATMLAMIEATVAALPADRPRYLMGVGTPDDIVEAVARGVDMFDCVLPTRAGRHGVAYTRFGKINLKNARHADDAQPAGRGIRLPGDARLFARLPAPPGEVRGDAGRDAADLEQPRLLPGPDGGPARRHRRPAGSTCSWHRQGRMGGANPPTG